MLFFRLRYAASIHHLFPADFFELLNFVFSRGQNKVGFYELVVSEFRILIYIYMKLLSLFSSEGHTVYK